MAATIEARLAELGIELPDAPAPVSNYMPYVVAGNLVFISGQVTLWNGDSRSSKVTRPRACAASTRSPR
jgi:enamine deaminase RidA (YjgF/YER057c/UK114 family)